ncbi:hypothetical protein DRO97_10530 [Archaeoglobales archaeon]|nr:MAG: hypothetical protein DRO97_10530 [Archaeoglobales archaeon]
MDVVAQNDIDKRIVETLKKHSYGLSTTQIASVAGLNRMTVSRHLDVLKAKGFVDFRRIGPAKLWYLTEAYLETTYIIHEVERPYILKMLKGEKSKPLREKLGDFISLHLFRLERMALVLMSGADSIMYKIGQEIAKEVSPEVIKNDKIEEIFDGLANIFEKLRIGILELREYKNERVNIRIYECVTCSGMPNIGKTVCYFEGGLMAGTYEVITKRTALAIETKCWGTGYKYCEFEIRLNKRF